MAVTRPLLMIATPCYGGQVTNHYAASLLALQQACGPRGIDLRVLMPGGDALITRARAELVAHFLADPAATHLLFIDADIGFAPDQVFRLIDFDADVTAAIYPVKRVNWQKAQAVMQAGRQMPQAAMDYVLDVADPTRVATRDGFVQVRYAGTGFLMIRRAAIEALCARHPELAYRRIHQTPDPLSGSPHRCALFDPIVEAETGLYLSEDYAFCRRWTEAGGEVWADLASRLTHVGPVAFDGDLTTQFGPAPGS